MTEPMINMSGADRNTAMPHSTIVEKTIMALTPPTSSPAPIEKRTICLLVNNGLSIAHQPDFPPTFYPIFQGPAHDGRGRYPRLFALAKPGDKRIVVQS